MCVVPRTAGFTAALNGNENNIVLSRTFISKKCVILMSVNERNYTEFQTMSLMERGLKKYFVCLRKHNITSTESTVARSGILLLMGEVNSDSP